MDGLNVWGRTTDITVVGLGQSELDDIAGGGSRRDSAAS